MTDKATSINTRTIFLALMILWVPICAASAGQTPTIRFAYQDRVGSVIPIVAVTKGFFANEGVKIKPLRFSSGPACAEALFSGAADIGGMGDTTAIIMTTRNPAFVIIASHATGEHRHRVMVRENSAIRTLGDLRGKRLGVKKGTSTYGGLLAALSGAGLAQTDIDIIDLTPPIMTDALLAGSLDAFVASEPTPSAAEGKGARELTTLGGLGNAYPILLLAKRKWVESQPDVVARFIGAMQQAADYSAQHSEETTKIMAAETGLPLATTRRAMSRHDYRLRMDDGVLSSLEQTARFLKGQNIITQLPDFSVTATSKYLE